MHLKLIKVGLNANNEIGGMMICFDGLINSSIIGDIDRMNLLYFSYGFY